MIKPQRSSAGTSITAPPSLTDSSAQPLAQPLNGAERSYRRYALTLLMVIYAVNMLDRQIVTILAEPMKIDLHLADWQLGAISGLAFAVFYTVLGIPVARLADRGDRAYTIAGSLALWSGFTMACGLARTFPQLLLARLGVGVGEAGCTPPAHSLITEYSTREKRASALAFYSLGIPIGSLVGLAAGGLIADTLGWRAAFALAGAPGLVLAVITALTLKEPRRLKVHSPVVSATTTLGETLRDLGSKPSFWLVSFAAGFAAFVYYGEAAFFGPLFMRTHALQLAALAHSFGLKPAGFLGVALGLIVGVCAGLGTLLGGRLADRAARSDASGYARVPTAVLIIAAPLFSAIALSQGLWLALTALGAAVFFHSLAYGSTFAAVQTVARPRDRAMAAAILLFLTNLIGLGFGPLTLGVLSDVSSRQFGVICGLRFAMTAAPAFMIVSAGLFWLAIKYVRADEDPSGRT